MEKYKIIGRKPNGDIILESNNGAVEVIDEGRFSDLYTKTKNAVLNFVKKHGRILVKIGDVIAENVINIFDVLKKGTSHVFVNSAAADMLSENGVEIPNEEFLNYIDIKDEKDSDDVPLLLAKSILALQKYVQDGGSVLESGHVDFRDKLYEDELYTKPEDFDPDEEEMRFYGMRKNDAPISDKTKDKWKRLDNITVSDLSKKGVTPINNVGSGQSERVPRSLDSDIPGVKSWDYETIAEEVKERFEDIIERKITDISAKNVKSEAMTSYKPFLILGESGIGKTSVIKQIIKEIMQERDIEIQLVYKTGAEMSSFGISAPAKVNVRNIRRDRRGAIITGSDGKQSNFVTDRETIGHIPAVDIPMFNIMDAEVNDEIVEMDKSLGYGILFLDELSRSQMDDKSTIMSLIRNYGIGQYKLGTHWMIIAASNPISMSEGGDESLNNAGAVLRSMLSDDAIKNTFQLVNYRPKLSQWLEWATKHGVNKSVIAFLSNPKTSYHWFNTYDKVPELSGALSNPRLWAELGFALNKYESKHTSKDIQTALKLVKKCQNLVDSNMPFEQAFIESYRADKLEITSDDYKNMWVAPDKIVEKVVQSDKDGTPLSVDTAKFRRLRNNMLNHGNGRMTDVADVIDNIVDAFPFVNNNCSADEFKSYIENDFSYYMNNFAEFLSYFYSESDEHIKSYSNTFHKVDMYTVSNTFEVRCKTILSGVLNEIFVMLLKLINTNKDINDYIVGKNYRSYREMIEGAIFYNLKYDVPVKMELLLSKLNL